MNERIRELADEAREFATTRHPVSNITLSVNSDLFEQKFAESIVAEMLQTCEDHPAWTGRMIGEEIKQRFGVEV
jgi:hypothetical protein